MTPDGLPETLGEYLRVWCADLFEKLPDEKRDRIIQSINMMYAGGPWPDRLSVQRIAEIDMGVLTSSAVIGLLDEERGGGVEGAIRRLSEHHESAVKQLSRMPGTPHLVAEVEAAFSRGELTAEERLTILSSATAQPIAPPPIPLPRHLRPLPENYPESYDEWQHRDPSCTCAS